MKKNLMLFTTMLLVAASALPGSAQQSQAAMGGQQRIGLPIDWSTRHVIHSGMVDDEFATASRHEPRILFSWLQRNNARNRAGAFNSSRTRLAAPKKSALKRDWNFTLGSGTVAPNQFPAKFGFDVNATPDCANDYVIYGLNVGGSSSQPNLVGFNNLYTGTATGTAISAITGNGTTVTVTSTAHGLIAGNNVYISGVTNTSFNGTFTVATATTNQFTFASTVNASSSGGTAAKVNGLC